jgi:hypothetical protein
MKAHIANSPLQGLDGRGSVRRSSARNREDVPACLPQKLNTTRFADFNGDRTQSKTLSGIEFHAHWVSWGTKVEVLLRRIR